MDIPLDEPENVLAGLSPSSITLAAIYLLNLPMKVFWQIHSVEYIRSHLNGRDRQMAIKSLGPRGITAWDGSRKRR
jgi:hypothetical protein